MDIELHPVTIREVVEGYTDDGEGGVFGYGGRLGELAHVLSSPRGSAGQVRSFISSLSLGCVGSDEHGRVR